MSSEYGEWQAARHSLVKDVQVILARFRREQGWQPGMVWNPRTGRYESPGAPESPVPAQGEVIPRPAGYGPSGPSGGVSSPPRSHPEMNAHTQSPAARSSLTQPPGTGRQVSR